MAPGVNSLEKFEGKEENAGNRQFSFNQNVSSLSKVNPIILDTFQLLFTNLSFQFA